MTETGVVLRTEGETALVSMTRTEACAKCRVCTMGMDKETMTVRARNLCGASAGQSVEIELAENSFIKAALIMYGIPLVCMLAGFFGADYLLVGLGDENRELWSLVSGLVLLGLSCLLISLIEKRIRRGGAYEPAAVRIARE